MPGGSSSSAEPCSLKPNSINGLPLNSRYYTYTKDNVVEPNNYDIASSICGRLLEESSCTVGDDDDIKIGSATISYDSSI
jgi:hypothetical protein